MSDLEPEGFAEFVTTDGPGSADAGEQGSGDAGRPEPDEPELRGRPEPVNDLIQRSAEEPDEETYR
ncbi:hypothetical protein [Actinoplanes siamensis]|uniref:Uncharacterized protein n=1 Tax=Actinoplanes siamensis TaxID=1223317 RepID=A0A919N985_9ACTN|nr:hypothetical protein [Actinoplanes siamensis]GIF06631.1 hypothetical protein Asi03nite_41690 [Actinoplanes siamensis]